MKKTRNKPRTTSDIKRKTKKGKSIPLARKKRPTARFYEIKIRLSDEEYERGKPYFQEHKFLLKFLLDAYKEKVNRAESHDKFTKQRTLHSYVKLFEPVLKEMFITGKLNFLFEKLEKGENHR